MTKKCVIFNDKPKTHVITSDSNFCILKEISRRSFEWEIEVNNLAYGRMVDGKMEFEHLIFNQEKKGGLSWW